MTSAHRLLALALSITLVACGGGGGSGGSTATEDSPVGTANNGTNTSEDNEDEETPEQDLEPEDITNIVLESREGDCAAHAGTYRAKVLDIQRAMQFIGNVEIIAGETSCELISSNIPNHDFNDDTARFASDAQEITQNFNLPREPTAAGVATTLSQTSYDAVFLNGVVLDLLSAGCYRPADPMADAEGNTPVGCSEDSPWLLDPMSEFANFGTDLHNAHVQPSGLYHYHGDPVALFDDNPGPNGSPVIGYAADGFPIYGAYLYDRDTGTVRKAVSGYALKSGQRPTSAVDPGGNYDGRYIDDYEFTNAGDLDACNGMIVDGQYGYYVTSSYPWVLGCLLGEPDTSFSKR